MGAVAGDALTYPSMTLRGDKFCASAQLDKGGGCAIDCRVKATESGGKVPFRPDMDPATASNRKTFHRLAQVGAGFAMTW